MSFDSFVSPEKAAHIRTLSSMSGLSSSSSPPRSPTSPREWEKMGGIQRSKSNRAVVPSKAVFGQHDEWKPEQPKDLSLSSGAVDVNAIFFKLTSTAELNPGWVAAKERQFSMALAKCATHNLMKKLYGNVTRDSIEHVSLNGT